MFQDGGVLKFSNMFTWDANRDNTSPDTTSANITEMSRSSRPTRRSTAPSPPTQRDENTTAGDGPGETHEREQEFTAHIQFPPVIRTTVEGKLKMEKTVGTHLRVIDHSIAKAYTIRDTTTHYRIRTKLGKREVVLEEMGASTADDSRSEVRSIYFIAISLFYWSCLGGGTYRLSVYEDGREIDRREADISVPDNMVGS